MGVPIRDDALPIGTIEERADQRLALLSILRVARRNDDIRREPQLMPTRFSTPHRYVVSLASVSRGHLDRVS